MNDKPSQQETLKNAQLGSEHGAFRERMQSIGLEPPEQLEPNKFHRFPGIGKQNGTDGFCLLFHDLQGGIFGDWSSGINPTTWQAKSAKPRQAAERAAFKRQVEASRKLANEQRTRENEQAAEQALQRWNDAQPADPGHPYLIKKKTDCRDLRQDREQLLIPMRDESDKLWSLQTIDKDGNKLFSPKGCRTSGCYFPIGHKPAAGQLVCVAEGWATAMAIHEATNHPTVVAFSAHNLETVARIIKGNFTENHLVIAADDDQKTGTEKNPGVEAATKAAKAVGGVVAIPDMGKKADFWDVWKELGAEAVRAAITGRKEEVETSSTPEHQPNGKGFALIRLSEITLTPPKWLVRPVIELDSLAMLFGDPASGKTFVAVDLTCCVVTGEAFHGFSSIVAPVVYVAGEGRHGLKKRFMAWSIRHQINLDNSPLFISNMPAAFLDHGSVESVMDAIDKVEAEHGAPGLIVIDTVARNFGGGDENSTADMSAFIQAADLLREKYRAAILLVHHSGHGDKTRARGAMALKGALDFEYRLVRGNDGVIRADCTKCKDHEPLDPMAFNLRPVDLPMEDDDGNPVTSAVLDQVVFEPELAVTKNSRGKNQSTAREILEGLYAKYQSNLEADERNPDLAKVALNDWRQECSSKGMARNRFHEAKKALIESGNIREDGGFVFLH